MDALEQVHQVMIYGIAQLRGACAVGHDTTFDDSQQVERS